MVSGMGRAFSAVMVSSLDRASLRPSLETFDKQL